MQSQKPSWRNARSCPAAARRSSGSRSSTLSGSSTSSAAGSKQKNPAFTHSSLRGFSVNPSTDPSPSEAGHAEREPGLDHGHRRGTARARGDRPAAPRGRCRPRRRRSARQNLGSPSSSAGAARCKPPARRRVDAGVKAGDLDIVGPAHAGHERLAPARRGTRSATGTAGSPEPGRSGSRATGSGGRRSRPAAWAIDGAALLQAGSAPAAQNHDGRLIRVHDRPIFAERPVGSIRRGERRREPRDLQGLRHPRAVRHRHRRRGWRSRSGGRSRA